MENKNERIKETAGRLLAELKKKIYEMRSIVSTEAELMRSTKGKEPFDSVMCALECTEDQIKDALIEWQLNNRVSGEKPNGMPI